MKTLFRFQRALLLLIALCAIGGLAHAAETVLYDKPSKYNNIIVTEDDDGLRVLRFEKGGARQTIAKPGHPEFLGFAYTKVAFVGLALAKEPQRMMIVGVGGGTMPMFLRHYYPEAVIDAVDIDPDVVHVAKTYFGLREDERLSTVTAHRSLRETHLDGPARRKVVDKVAAAVILPRIPPLSRLVDDEEWPLVEQQVAYNASASFLAYLLESFGADVPDAKGRFVAPRRKSAKEEKKLDELDWRGAAAEAAERGARLLGGRKPAGRSSSPP